MRWPFLDNADMGKHLAELFQRVGDVEVNAFWRHDHAAVASLSAKFAIEGRLIDDDDAVLRLFSVA